jgi:CO dehydrogenase maturation factor
MVMRIAVTGKGGSGKSTIAGALARQLARSRHRVVAVDADPNPNLGVSLGLSHEAVEAMRPILNALLASGHTHHDPKPAPEELLARYGVEAPDGIVVVATGKIERPADACLCCGSHNTTREFFGALPADDRCIVADLEAGLNDLIWARPGRDDVVLAVAEPSAKSVEIARRACRIAESLGVFHIIGVANRSTDGHAAGLAETLGVDVVEVPFDPAVEEADRRGAAPMDLDDSSPAMVAVGRLAERLPPQPWGGYVLQNGAGCGGLAGRLPGWGVRPGQCRPQQPEAGDDQPRNGVVGGGGPRHLVSGGLAHQRDMGGRHPHAGQEHEEAGDQQRCAPPRRAPGEEDGGDGGPEQHHGRDHVVGHLHPGLGVEGRAAVGRQHRPEPHHPADEGQCPAQARAGRPHSGQPGGMAPH